MRDGRGNIRVLRYMCIYVDAENSDETTIYVIYTKWLICKNAVLLEMLRIREVHVEHILESQVPK